MSTTAQKLLLIEDTPSLARVYQEYLKSEDYEVQHVDTGKKALDVLSATPPALVLLDLMLPDMDGMEILREVQSRELPTTVVVITAHGSVNVAVEAMRDGAFDFLVKPFNAERLKVTLRNAARMATLQQEVATYRDDIDRQNFCGYIGASLPMQGVYRTIESAAKSKATVFVTGESGTGKELCAEAVHKMSPRSSKPFIPLNCGAIPKDLMESEIFGHVKGSFTGAVADREGAARRADGGTLFLDELCEMDLSLQTKLLRFLQTGSFTRVGGTRQETVDIRFVCATNRDPLIEVQAGRFREDLYYRLHVVPIHLPPLRDRDDDVLLIARDFLKRFSDEEGKAFKAFSRETELTLLSYDWPGNVRQLQNVLRNAVVLNEGTELTPDMLPPPLNDPARAFPDASPGQQMQMPPVTAEADMALADSVASLPPASATAQSLMPAPSPSFPSASPAVPASHAIPVSAPAEPAPLTSSPGEILPLWLVEKQAIENAIERCDGNIPRAAALLEINASTIYRKRQAWAQKEG